MVSFTEPVVTIQGSTGATQQFTRDQSITVSVTFYDTSGNVVNPAGANLTLSYPVLNDGCRLHTTYALVETDDVWAYAWDSSAAQRGVVYGHIASSDKAYAVDFSFRLTSNLSNRELAGDDTFNGYCP